MKAFLKSMFLFATMIVYFSTFGQIKWEVVDESFTLTPSIIVEKGTLDVFIGRSKDQITKEGTGEITIDLTEKVIYLNDGNNIYKFKSDLIKKLTIEGYKIFIGEELFKKEFADSLLFNYRKKIYPKINLIEIEFSSSKRVLYDFSDEGFVLKNQKKSKGKICYVSPTRIIILYDNGELDEFKDGDFNFLQVNSFKAFKCRNLYDYLFKDFENGLIRNIKRWENEILKLNLDSAISLFGVIDNITSISPDRRMISWKKERPVYNINLSNTKVTSSYSKSSSQTNYFSTRLSTIYSISPFFLYGNAYRTEDVSFSSSGITLLSSQSSQSGYVRLEDDGYSITMIQDNNGKNLRIFHQNVFSEPRYGEPFRFVSF
jgi:hypothetical protein